MDFNAIDVMNGDCKAIWTPWNNKEAFAVRNLKIPAEFVRQWIFTLVDYEKAKNNTIKDTFKEEIKEETIESKVEEIIVSEIEKDNDEKPNIEEIEEKLEEIKEESDDLSNLSIKELRVMAKEKWINSFWMNIDKLREVILNTK